MPIFSRRRDTKHVKPLEHQNRGTVVIENLQYLISFSATCPPGWWPRLSHNGVAGGGHSTPLSVKRCCTAVTGLVLPMKPEIIIFTSKRSTINQQLPLGKYRPYKTKTCSIGCCPPSTASKPGLTVLILPVLGSWESRAEKRCVRLFPPHSQGKGQEGNVYESKG